MKSLFRYIISAQNSPVYIDIFDSHAKKISLKLGIWEVTSLRKY